MYNVHIYYYYWLLLIKASKAKIIGLDYFQYKHYIMIVYDV